MSKIIHFQSSFFEKMLFFYKKHWEEEGKNYHEEYLHYRLFKVSNDPSDVDKNMLAIDNNDDIVGWGLIVPAKALILGEEQTIYWGNDLFFEKDHRKTSLSKELLIKRNDIERLFLYGLSPSYRKIQIKIQNNFIAETTGYFILNRWTVKVLFFKLGLISPKINDLRVIPNEIKVKSDVFELVKRAEDISIPNNGYWNKGKLDIEMKRNVDFFKHRFFEHFNTYYFYQKKTGEKKSYFVFRKIVKKGVSAISLVDFRYDLEDFDEYLKILYAIKKIAVKNREPLVVVRSTILDKKIRFRPFVIRNEKKCDVVTNIKDILSPSTFITLADSDADLAIRYKCED